MLKVFGQPSEILDQRIRTALIICMGLTKNINNMQLVP